MSFSVASYNVLATAYIQRAHYPRTPSFVLDRSWRIPSLVQYISRLQTDVICLQEVEPEMLGPLRVRLGALGYDLQFGRKGQDKPDGCATFYRRSDLELLDARLIVYQDDGSETRDSGHVALVTIFKQDARPLGVINTHLTWDPSATPPDRRRGRRQMDQLLEYYKTLAHTAAGWIVAGDLNVTPESELVAMLERAGFDYAHRGIAEIRTCNVNGEAKMIDYLFHSSSLEAAPEPVVTIERGTVLPAPEQPSDHVPVLARFAWRD